MHIMIAMIYLGAGLQVSECGVRTIFLVECGIILDIYATQNYVLIELIPVRRPR